jgi:hypothetical protein
MLLPADENNQYQYDPGKQVEEIIFMEDVLVK